MYSIALVLTGGFVTQLRSRRRRFDQCGEMSASVSLDTISNTQAHLCFIISSRHRQTKLYLLSIGLARERRTRELEEQQHTTNPDSTILNHTTTNLDSTITQGRRDEPSNQCGCEGVAEEEDTTTATWNRRVRQ